MRHHQFTLRQLLYVALTLPLLIGMAAGTLGELLQVIAFCCALATTLMIGLVASVWLSAISLSLLLRGTSKLTSLALGILRIDISQSQR